MTLADRTLYNHAQNQLRRLCAVTGFEPGDENPSMLLRELLGPAAGRPLHEPPYPCDVADDGTPVEFSIAFDDDGRRALRILGEAGSENPGGREHIAAGKRFLDAVGERFHTRTDRFAAVADLFLTEQPQATWALWFSLILRPGGRPKLKAYFNPQVHGRDDSSELVREGFRRLGLDHAYDPITRHALTRGERDWFSFFAIDLDDSPQSRVKLYVSHDEALTADAERAACAVAGADPMRVREFCDVLAGDTHRFDRKPLMSGYSFVDADQSGPGTYSLYLPIRSYVPDDAVARERVGTFLAGKGLATDVLDDAISAVTNRPLYAGVGLLAHVSLRLGHFGSGTTVYLSSEAYQVTPPPRSADTVTTGVSN